MQSGVQEQSFEVGSIEQSQLSSWIRAYVPAQMTQKNRLEIPFSSIQATHTLVPHIEKRELKHRDD
jgi:hypothetical protein